MRASRLSSVTIALILLLLGWWNLRPLAGQSQGGSATIDVQRLGPQVGQSAPTFSLRDQTGIVRTLQSVTGPNGLMLVLFRSADW